MKLTRPNREPDLVIPNDDAYSMVEVWVYENIFHIVDGGYEGNYRVNITSSGVRYDDPMGFIERMAERGVTANRRYTCQKFLDELDRAILGEDGEAN